MAKKLVKKNKTYTIGSEPLYNLVYKILPNGIKIVLPSPGDMHHFGSDLQQLMSFGLIPSGPGDVAMGPVTAASKGLGEVALKYIKKLTQPGLFGEKIFMGTKKGKKAAINVDVATAREANKANKATEVTQPVINTPSAINIQTGEEYPTSVLDKILPGWRYMTGKEGWYIRQ